MNRCHIYYALGFLPAILSLLGICFLPEGYGSDNYVFVEELGMMIKISSLNGLYIFTQAWWAAISLFLMDSYKKKKVAATYITVISMLIFCCLWLFSIMVSDDYTVPALLLISGAIFLLFVPLWVNRIN